MLDDGPAIDAQEVLALTQQGMMSDLFARLRPNVPAVHAPRGVRTFKQLHENANRLVAALRGAGLKPGDHWAIILPNGPQFIEAVAANARSGLRLTPINWHLSPDEAAYVVNDCHAKALICDADFASAGLAGAAASDRLLCKLAVGGEIEGFDSYEAALAAESPANPPQPMHGGTMLYTSGTTGRPKGVYRKHSAAIPPLWGGAAVMFKSYRFEGDVNLCCGPAYHAAPLALDVSLPLTSGVPIVLTEKFDPEDWLRTVEKYRVTHVHMVSTMFQRLLALPAEVRGRHDLSSLRQILHGAAPTPPQVKHAMIEWLGPILTEYYAASEGGANFVITSEEWLSKPGSVGRLDPAAGGRIINEQGQDVGVGEVGQIYFPHNPLARFEYFNDKEKTAAAELGDTHFTVGDMGYIDEDGYLYLTGRTAECIISGGVNIYPQEVDNELIKHPAVRDVCTIGAPNDEWGEEVKSVISLHPGYVPGEDLAKELIAFARARLAGFKTPRSIDFADDIPRSEAGKVQRRQVRAPYWAGRLKQI